MGYMNILVSQEDKEIQDYDVPSLKQLTAGLRVETLERSVLSFLGGGKI